MKQKVTAVFDIGKTNKKFFLFDKDFKEVHKEYISFDEIKDEDGYPTENLPALEKWLFSVLDKIIKKDEFKVKAINFSTYGASLVHIDEKGKPLTPLYNYTKPLNKSVIESFIADYGPREEMLKTTGCVDLSMLNSGLQLYWLKRSNPEKFKNIKYSLHFPQYLSYLFTGIPLSDYTSIGCHTALWDYSKNDYHSWVYREGINKILAPIVSTETSINIKYRGSRMKVGVGIHDSSSALIPYIESIKKNFVLISTGTWSIVFNPFTKNAISSNEQKDIDVVNYMRINGNPVTASRLFLGNEYKDQVKKLNSLFSVDDDYHRLVKFDQSTYLELMQNFKHCFRWVSITDSDMPEQTEISYETYEQAYHQLMIELVLLQIKSVKKAIGDVAISRIYVDGGFSDNDLFIKLLSHSFKDKELRTTNASLGSALGAAISISDTKLNSRFLKNNYALKKHVPFINE